MPPHYVGNTDQYTNKPELTVCDLLMLISVETFFFIDIP